MELEPSRRSHTGDLSWAEKIGYAKEGGVIKEPMFLRYSKWSAVIGGDIINIGVMKFEPREMGRSLQFSAILIDSPGWLLTPHTPVWCCHRKQSNGDPEWGQLNLESVQQIFAECLLCGKYRTTPNTFHLTMDGTFSLTTSTLIDLSKTCLLSL